MVDNNGWVTSLTDENGFTTSYGYDDLGQLERIIHPTGDSTAWNDTTRSLVQVATAEYGIAGGHWRETVATGNARRLTYYDALLRPLVTREYDTANSAGTSRFRRFAYDLGGRTTFAAYPGATATLTTGTWSEYDALGRPTSTAQDSELGLLNTLTAYLSGARVRVTNPRSQQTTTTYMAYGQPSTEWPVLIDHPEGAFTHITRDAFGRPLSLRRSNSSSPGAGTGITRSYLYNSHGELCRATEPETGATLMGYDGTGNLAWSAAGLPAGTACDAEGDTATILARKSVRTYDQRNRVSTLSFPDNLGNTTYDYTPDGLLASLTAMNDGVAVRHDYTYNRRRLLTHEELLYGNINWNLAHAYNSNGHLLTDTYPTGLAITYAPNALGQPTQAGSYATGVSYFPNGAIKQFTYGNGIVHTMTQNARQLPDTSRDAYGSTEFLDDGYDYDGNGNVAAISDGVSSHLGRMDRDMTYDGLDRLKTVDSPMFGPAGAAYTYDVLDNLTRVFIDDGGPNSHPRDYYYCYDANGRLGNIKTGGCSTGATVVGLDYDAQGNLENKNGTTYAFDYGNRLRTVDPAGTTAPNIIYTYDGHGRRARDLKGTAGYRISFYSQGGQLAFTRDGRSGKYANYVYLGGSLIATREWPIGTGAYTTKYHHTDALGSPVAVTNANRAMLERSEYEPFGQVLNRPVADGPGYTGHVMDAATGFAYMQQRYYDPGIGRFLSVDPVSATSVGGNFNQYWYANNNPYRFTDPDGRIAYQVGNTIYIPVTFRGSGASAGLIRNVVNAANRLVTQDGTRIVVVPVNRVLGGVNVMNISPGLTNRANSTYGEGVVKGPGVIPNSGAHIDSRRSDPVGAVLHDTLHFAGLDDRYTESSSSTFGNRGESNPDPGYEDSIMARTDGTMLYQEETKQFQNAYNGLLGEKEWEELQERISDDQ